VCIVRHQQRVPVHLVHRGQIADRVVEGAAALRLLEVADVLPGEGLPVHDQRDRVLQIAAHREHRPFDGDLGNRLRRIAACPAQQHHATAGDARHRVVHATGDGTPSDEERVGHTAQSRPCVVVFVRDRLARSVRARHHEHVGSAGREEQVMHRRVGKHHPELVALGRHAGMAVGVAARREHDRPCHRGQERLGVRGQVHELPCHVEGAGHQRERLLLAVLALAKGEDGAGAGGIARQVIAAQSLDSDDVARRQKLRGIHHGTVAAPLPVERGHRQPIAGAAARTCHRLGVEPAILGIEVLALAVAVE
jgi:hypothetical protein